MFNLFELAVWMEGVPSFIQPQLWKEFHLLSDVPSLVIYLIKPTKVSFIKKKKKSLSIPLLLHFHFDLPIACPLLKSAGGSIAHLGPTTLQLMRIYYYKLFWPCTTTSTNFFDRVLQILVHYKTYKMVINF